MSIKKILMSAVCTVFLLVSTASAENKENTEPWTAPLEAAILEGFGTRFTILLPPIEAYRIGVFSPSPGDGFGFIGNTFPASDSTREIYLGITSENFPASSAHKTAADRLNENVDRFISNMPMLKSKSFHISQDISLSQDGHPARLIRIAHENEAIRRDLLFVAADNREWRIDILYYILEPQQSARIDTIFSSIKIDRSNATEPVIHFDGFQPTKSFEE